MSHDTILRALRALAEHDSEMSAPPAVEARLLREFAARRGRKKRRWLMMTPVAAALAVAAILSLNPGAKLGSRKMSSVWETAAQGIKETPPDATPVSIAAAPAARKTVPKVAGEPHPETREIVTDFFPLMNPAPAFERGQLLRVQLPASAMQTVGLPVGEEHLADLVEADVLMGEEGMPRAIRFVRFENR